MGEREHGTILLMFPAAVLIMFLLGAVVVDVSLVQLRARELEAVAGSAANDALSALDVDALRNGEGIVIGADHARAVVRRSVAAGPLPSAHIDDVSIAPDSQGRQVIAVTLSLDVDLVMAPAVGDLDSVRLQRTGRAVILGSEFG